MSHHLVLPRPRVLPAATVAGCVAALALPAGPAGAQSTPKLRTGIYDCYSYDASRSSLDYDSSVKLLSRNRYEYSAARNGRVMRRKSTGTYRRSRNTMTFVRGRLDRVRARVVPGSTPRNPAKFNLLGADGKAAGITCTYVTDKRVNP
jgi:hypothetical protein